MTGVKVRDYLFSDFDYDAMTHTATWKLAKPLASDKLLLHLVDAVHGAAGAMDGDKDGNPGGDLMVRFNVQPGDVDGDGRTNVFDKIKTRGRSGARVGEPNYSAFHDVDGSGDITSSDIRLVRSERLTELPAGEPTKSQRPLVELSSDRVQSGRMFDVLVHRGPPRAPVNVQLFHDGPEPVHPFEGGITEHRGKARITLLMPKGLIRGGEEDGFRVLGSVGSTPFELSLAVVKETEVFLSPTRIKEGETFRIVIRRGVPHSLIDVDIHHDGQLIHEYGFIETDGAGNADVLLAVPSRLLTGGITENAFLVRVGHGGEVISFPITVLKGQSISISPPDRIRELDVFNVRVERGIGRSLRSESPTTEASRIPPTLPRGTAP